MASPLDFGLLLSFAVGVLSSLCATWLLFLRRRSRYRLHFRSVLTQIEDLVSEIKQDGFTFDHILALGRNSGVVGSIIAGVTGLSAATSISLIKSRNADGSRSICLAPIDELMLPGLADKAVLVLICCNDSGATLEYVVKRLNSLERQPKSLRTAALYTSPSPVFKPTYIGVVVGDDTKKTMSEILVGLPWVSPSWIHPFGRERNVVDTAK